MNSQVKITHKSLIGFGFEKTDDLITPYRMRIGVEPEDDESGLEPMYIVIDNMYNVPQFCLLLCEGQRLYLFVRSLSDLKAFIESIDRYEPVW